MGINHGGSLRRGEKEMRRTWVMLSLALLVAAFAMTATAGTALATGSTVRVTPTEDLAAVVASSPQNTRFVLEDGTYAPSATVVPKAGDSFAGNQSDSSRPLVTGSGKLTRVFDVSSPGVRFTGIAITGSHGAESCEPGCGKAVAVRGGEATFWSVRVYGNPNQGITATKGAVVRVLHSRLDHNGSYPFTILDKNSPTDRSSSAGVKAVGGSKLVVDDSRVDHNYWNALWTDNRAAFVRVTDSTIEDNGKTGVQIEISDGGAILRNRFFQNGHLDEPIWTTRAGLLVSNSSHVNVSGNSFVENANHGVANTDNGREPGLHDVEEWSNTFRANASTPMGGCRRPRDVVYCHDNRFLG